METDSDKPPLVPTLFERVYERERGRCFWCRMKVNALRKCGPCPKGGFPFNHPTQDHILPKSRGGTRSIHNLVLSCHGCNRAKGNRLINPATGQAISPKVLWVFLKD